MTLWQYIPAAVLILLLMRKIRSAWKKRRARLERDFSRKLETVLQPRETLKAVLTGRNQRWVLTSRRLLLDTKEGFTAVPFTAIKKAQGYTREGEKTASSAKMDRLTITAEKEYTVYNTGEEFTLLAKTVLNRVKKQNEKKKAGEKKQCPKEKK